MHWLYVFDSDVSKFTKRVFLVSYQATRISFLLTLFKQCKSGNYDLLIELIH